MKLLAINGSPRKNWNTAQLLTQITEGANNAGAKTSLVHLLRCGKFTGCISCFECKRIGGKSYGRCSVDDGLTPVLDEAHEADVLVLGTPFYFMQESALMRSLMERLWFQYYLYSKVKPPLAPKKKACALVYTMNIPEEMMDEYGKTPIVKRAKQIMERLFAPCEVLLACDTMQFKDYSLYDTDIFDIPGKQKRHAEVFPETLAAAFKLGQKLVAW